MADRPWSGAQRTALRRAYPSGVCLPMSAIGGRKRCRLHGGLSPGAPLGARNGAWRHGGATNEAKAQRKAVRALLREARKILDGDT